LSKTPLNIFHRRARRNPFRRRDVRQQRRLFARWNPRLKQSGRRSLEMVFSGRWRRPSLAATCLGQPPRGPTIPGRHRPPV